MGQVRNVACCCLLAHERGGNRAEACAVGPVRLIACCCGSGQGRGLRLPAMHGGTCINAEADALGDLHPCRGCWHHPSLKTQDCQHDLVQQGCSADCCTTAG